MKKFDNFINSLKILKKADVGRVEEDEIYRTGVIGQFNLTFELAWKALQAVLQLNGVAAAEIGAPREIVKLGYKYALVNDEPVWLAMLKDRNVSVHIYNEDAVLEIINRIINSYIPALEGFGKTMADKIKELD